MKVRLMLLLALLVPLSAAGLESHPRASLLAFRPFEAGERLTYAVSWLGIRGGTAKMEVTDAAPIDGRATLRLRTIAKSSPWFSKIYPIDNRVESLVDAETMSPHRMTFQRREGKQKNDFDVTFRHREGLVLEIKDGVPQTLAIPAETHDLISCLYYVRSLPSIEPGSTMMLNLHHDRKNYRIEVRVEGVERLSTRWGDMEAVRVLVVMPFQGIFLNEGNIRVWLTHDDRRIPIMMKAKVIIGSVTATLVDRHDPGRSIV
jgi:Protein of unknown function (DUF3108)